MQPQDAELTLLVRDLIKVNHALARSLEHIVTSFEQLTGRIPDEKDLSAVVSQFAGLEVRVHDLLRHKGATY